MFSMMRKNVDWILLRYHTTTWSRSTPFPTTWCRWPPISNNCLPWPPPNSLWWFSSTQSIKLVGKIEPVPSPFVRSRSLINSVRVTRFKVGPRTPTKWRGFLRDYRRTAKLLSRVSTSWRTSRFRATIRPCGVWSTTRTISSKCRLSAKNWPAKSSGDRSFAHCAALVDVSRVHSKKVQN